MRHPLEGKQVRLVRCTDEHSNLRPDTEGVVMFVDAMGTVHVQWDNGSTLGLVPEAGDQYEVVAG